MTESNETKHSGSYPWKDSLTANDYQHKALRTVNPYLNASNLLQDGLMGLCGESGECIDILKKTLYQGHDLDSEKLKNELGDVAWYLAVSCHALGYTLEEVMNTNINKLKERYPDGFDKNRSINRE